LFNNSTTIPLKLKDFFLAKSAQFRLGLGVQTIITEDDPPLTVQQVRIEELDYFFDDTVILDLSGKLREQDIEKSVIPERFYKSAIMGYNKFDYDNDAGVLEFNTKSSWTTVIGAVFTELMKVIAYRADGQGMRLIMNAQTATDYDATKDVKGDSDIFMIDLVRGGGGFIARTNEGFDYIGGAVYADSSFNVRWSPARIMRKWGANIKAGLLHRLNSWVSWQTSDKNTTLESQLTGEGIVVENADVRVQDLEEPRMLAESYKINVPLTNDELNAIDANPNGLIKLAGGKHGWMLDVKYSIGKGMAEMVLIRKIES